MSTESNIKAITAQFNKIISIEKSSSIVNLDGIQLSNAHLNNIKLPDASLEDTYFNNADLVNAKLCDSYLYNAELKEADLTQAWLIDADLTRATLDKSILTKANLTNAKLIKTSLIGVDFQESILTNVNFTGADLEKSKNLWNAKLDGAIFKNASLKSINLEKINFNQTDFEGVELDNSILLGSDLSQVTNLNEQQLTGDNPPYLCVTLLPQDLQIDSDRDCDRLVNYFAELKKESKEEIQKNIDEIRNK